MSDSSTTQVVERAPAEGRFSGRSIGAALCLVVAVLLTTPAAIAYWGQRTLNDGERYLDTVGPLVDSPEVQQAIATTVVDAIEQQVDVEAVLNNVFADVITERPRLEQLVGPLSGAINGLIEREVNAFVASDTFEDIWIAVNTRAQQALVRLLNGDESGALSVQDGQVVLDLSAVIEEVKNRLVARGLTVVENVPIPDVDKQIVLLDAPQVEQVRTIYAFTNPVAQWLIVVVAALYLAAFLLARRRAADGGGHWRRSRIERVAGGVRFVSGASAVRQRTRWHGLRTSEQGVLRHAVGLPRTRLARIPCGWVRSSRPPAGSPDPTGQAPRSEPRCQAGWKPLVRTSTRSASTKSADGFAQTRHGCASPPGFSA